MNFASTPEHDALRDQIRTFARDRLNHDVVGRDRERRFSPDLWRTCGTHGLPGLPAPVEHGGRGFDPLTCVVALDALGYGCTDHGLTFALCAHLAACVVPIWQFGTEAQQRRYLPGLCDGRLIGAHAMTEAEAGSDSFNMRTVAERTAGGWRLHGAKKFVSNALHADLIVAFALTESSTRFHGGVTAFVLERSTPGLTISAPIDTMGLRTASVADIRLEDVRVEDAHVLGGVGAGAGVFARAMDWERICLFAAHVGQMERLLDRAVTHARTRQVGGVAIGKHQAVSHRIADMKVRVDAARLLTYRAASRLGVTRAVALDAAIAKLFVSEALVQTAMDTVQILGGNGYATDHEVERALRDAVGARIYSGTSEIQRNIISGWLGL
jgi:alkylation response protein AidB-like acyl-CoA dehydrogenase